MKHVCWVGAALLAGLFVLRVEAQSRAISGVISTTLTITEDSHLAGHVTCTMQATPCIVMDAPGITLALNGFTLTGRADPITGCNGLSIPGEIGIGVNGHAGVIVRGPGLVQRFRANGIVLRQGATRARVVQLSATTNCLSGIFVINTSDSEIEENMLSRNGSVDAADAGIHVGPGSSRNLVRRNVTAGNGHVDRDGGLPNDGGIIISTDARDNRVEENNIVGNTNGIILFPNTRRNLIRANVVSGNPPLQLSVSFPATQSVDIADYSPPGANLIEDNFCLTGLNTPCPNPVPPREWLPFRLGR